MLWVSGSICLLIWFVLRFPLHKSGWVHMFLLTAFALYVVQLAQDRRTRAYKAEQRPGGAKSSGS